MLHQEFEIRIVGIQIFFLISTYMPGEFAWHLVDAPPGKRTLQKHRPSTAINRLAEIDGTTFLKAVGESRVGTCRTQCNRHARTANQRQGETYSSEQQTWRTNRQDDDRSRK